MIYAAAYAVSAVVFGVLDFVWLGKVGRPIYDREMGEWLAPKPNMTAALAFYAIYLAGITYFATAPAMSQGSWQTAVVAGGLLGFVAYATWNLTNVAVLRDYPTGTVAVDLAWGTVATAVTALVTYGVVSLLPFAQRP